MRRVALKGLWLRRGRALLTTLAVVLGVAMVCGTYVLTDTISNAFDSIFTAGNQNTSAVITAKDLVEDSLSGVGDHPGVAAGQGAGRRRRRRGRRHGRRPRASAPTRSSSSTPTARTIGNEQRPQLGFGFDFALTRFNPFKLVGRPLPDRRPARSPSTAAPPTRRSSRPATRSRSPRQGAAAGRSRSSGVARFGDVNSLGGATIGLFTLPVAQQLLGKPGQFDTIAVAADPGRVRQAARRAACKPIVGADVGPHGRAAGRRGRRGHRGGHRASSATSCSPSASSRSASARS